MTAATTARAQGLCSCGSGRPLDACCLPLIEGRAMAPTAEALMRSRYTAFSLGRVDYIFDTHHTSTREDVSKDAIKDWCARAEWLGIEVLETAGGKEADDRGRVRFLVRYKEKGAIVNYHEDAYFEKENGAWRFVTGDMAPTRRQAAKVGRNDPCPCGSGKKHKRCCGAKE